MSPISDTKPRSGINASRHRQTGQVALMPQPDREEFNRFCDSIVADYHAEGPIELQLAQSLAEDYWRLNRARAWETNMLGLGYFDGTADRIDADHPQIADAFTQVWSSRNRAQSSPASPSTKPASTATSPKTKSASPPARPNAAPPSNRPSRVSVRATAA